MNQSQQIDQLLNALYEAKAGFKELEKNGKNSYFKNAKGQPHLFSTCLLYTSPSPRDLSTSRMPSSA